MRQLTYFVWLAPGNRFAGVQHQQLIGDAHDQRHVVFHQHHSDVESGQLAEQCGELIGVASAEARCRFVEQQYCRARGQCAGNLDQTAVDMGQFIGGGIHRALIADQCEQLHGDVAFCAAGGRQNAAKAATLHAGEYVIEYRQLTEQLGGLVGAGDTGARDFPGGQTGQFLLQRNSAAVRRVETADHVQRGGLACSVGADDAGDAAGAGGQADVGCGLHATEVDADAVDLQRGAVGRAGDELADAFHIRCCWRLQVLRAHPQAGGGTEQTARCNPQHAKQQAGEYQQAVLGHVRQHLRQQHDQQGAEHRAEDRASAADDHRQHKQSRLRERE